MWVSPSESTVLAEEIHAVEQEAEPGLVVRGVALAPSAEEVPAPSVEEVPAQPGDESKERTPSVPQKGEWAEERPWG